MRVGKRPASGDAHGNAMCESFFSTLEAELLAQRRFQSHAEGRMAKGARGSAVRSMVEWRLEVCFSYIECWYNPRRRHSSLGYVSPIVFERSMTRPQVAPTAAPASIPC